MSTTQYDPHAPMEIVSAAPVAGDVAGGTAVVVRGRNLAPIGPTGGQLHCHFGGSGNDDSSGSVPATFEHTSLARCESPAGVPPSPHTVVLGVSTNGVVDGATANFTYYRAAEPPTLTSISPRYADISQTTPIRIVGSNFAPTGKLYCKFGSRPGARRTRWSSLRRRRPASASTRLREAPPAADHLDVWEEATVRVTTDGERYSTTAQTFTYYTSPIVSSVAPTYGDLASADPITVRGAHFFRLPEGGNIACRYSAVADGSWIAAVDFVAEGSYVSVDTLRCAAPTAATGRTVAVAVSVNHQFTFTPRVVCRLVHPLRHDRTADPHPDRARLRPARRRRDAPVTAVGLNFRAHRFGIRLPVWRRGGRGDILERPGGALRLPPVEAPMTVAFSVTDAYDSSAALEPLVVASRPRASALVAEAAPAAWLTTPAWWRPHSRRLGWFGPDDSPPPPPLASSPPPPPPPLRSSPPPAPTSHVWAPALSYTYYDPERPPAATAAVPPYAYARPGAPARLITVRGSNFVPAEGLACKFDDVEVAATFVDSARAEVRGAGTRGHGPGRPLRAYPRARLWSRLRQLWVLPAAHALVALSQFGRQGRSHPARRGRRQLRRRRDEPMRVHRRGGGGGGGRGAAAEHRRHDCERRRAVLLLSGGADAAHARLFGRDWRRPLGRSAEHHILRCGPPRPTSRRWRRPSARPPAARASS